MKKSNISDTSYTLPDDMLIWAETDINGIIKEVNDGFVLASGYSRDELLGSPHKILRHADMPKAVFEDMWRTISQGEVWNFTIKNRRKDGRYYWVKASIAPKFCGEQIVGFLSVRKKASPADIALSEKIFAQIAKGEQPEITPKNHLERIGMAGLIGTFITLGVLLLEMHFRMLPEMAKHFMDIFAILSLVALTYYIGKNRFNPQLGKCLKSIDSLIQGNYSQPIQGQSGWYSLINILRVNFAHQAAKAEDSRRAAMQGERNYQTLMAFTQAGIWDWDLRANRVSHNPYWYSTLGYEQESFDHSVENFVQLIHPADRDSVHEKIQALLEGRDLLYTAEYRLRHLDGHYLWVKDKGKIIEWDEQDKPIRMAGSFSDITALKQHNQELEAISHTDSLTFLPNRLQFERTFNSWMNENSPAFKNITLALVDLDDFKPVNDLHGHKMGDYVLQQISWRLASFGQDHRLIARIGGDEFVILQHAADHTSDDLNALFTQVCQSLNDPISLPNGVTVQLTASIGYACTCNLPRNRTELLKKADEAMYTMKGMKGQKTAKVYCAAPCAS